MISPPLPNSDHPIAPKTRAGNKAGKRAGNRKRIPDDTRPLAGEEGPSETAHKDPRPPALLVKGVKPYPDLISAIKEHMSPEEFGGDTHFVKSRRGELLIRFAHNDRIEGNIRRVRNKLLDMGPEIIKNVVTLGRLDRILILDLDPSATVDEILGSLRAAVPKKQRGIIRVAGHWQTTSGHGKAVASVPRGSFARIVRIKVGFFLSRVQVGPPPPSRCYKCQDFGHFRKTCKGPDLSGKCRRCAGAHATNKCDEGREKCVACDRRGIPPVAHNPGSTQCGARRVAEERGPPDGPLDSPPPGSDVGGARAS